MAPQELEAAREEFKQGEFKEALQLADVGVWAAYSRRDTSGLQTALVLLGDIRALVTGKLARKCDRLIRTALRLLAASTEEEAAEERRRREKAAEEQRTVRERFAALEASRRARDVNAVRCFEYSVLDIDRAEAARHLNEAGSLGWELVGVQPSPAHTSPARHTFYFKREVVARPDDSSTGTTSAGASTSANVPADPADIPAAERDLYGGLKESLGSFFDERPEILARDREVGAAGPLPPADRRGTVDVPGGEKT